MRRNCNNCTIEYEATTSRSKFCSDKCRKAYGRNNSSVTDETESIVTQDKTVPETNDSDVTLTKTDQLFRDDAIKRDFGSDWLAFSKITRNPTCRTCGKRFKTRLPLLNYCSPECRAKDLHA